MKDIAFAERDSPLFHQEHDYKDLLHNLSAAVYTCDKQGRINFFNEAAVELWGRTPVIGQDKWCGSWRIYHTDGRPMPLDECPMAVTLRQGIPVLGKVIVVERPDGIKKHIQPFPRPVFNKDNSLVGAINLLLDITDKFRSEEAVRQSEIRNRDLEQFAYVASHDLQEPLRKIMTYSGLLEENLENPVNAKAYLEKINHSVQRMSSLINSVLNYSRLSAVDDHFTDVDLNETMEFVKQDYDLLISQSKAEISHDKLPVVKGIPVQLGQVFSNIISNAIKYNNNNPVIRIEVDNLPSDEMETLPLVNGNTYIRISIIDNGIGIDPGNSAQLFKLFHRLDPSRSGTGIGLALCKKIIESHKGHISVSSRPEKGSTFTIYLPVVE